MSEADEEKKKRWAKSRAMSYMTPSMAHNLAMSRYQSQNKYKEQFNKTRGKGYSPITSTPEIEHAKRQSVRSSQNKYKSDFEKNKSKFTAIADDPETLRVKRVTNQVSKIAYEGKGSALAETKRRNRTPAKQDHEPEKPTPTEDADEVNTPQYTTPVDVEETIQEEGESVTKENGNSYQEEAESHSSNQEEPQSDNEQSDQASGGYDYNNTSYNDEEPKKEEQEEEQQHNSETYQENGNTEESYREAPQEEEDAGDHASREYQEADATDEPEVQEYSEGGLDDFYANLG